MRPHDDVLESMCVQVEGVLKAPLGRGPRRPVVPVTIKGAETVLILECPGRRINKDAADGVTGHIHGNGSNFWKKI